MLAFSENGDTLASADAANDDNRIVDGQESGVGDAVQPGRDRPWGEPVVDPPVVDRRDDGRGPEIDDEPDPAAPAAGSGNVQR